MARQHTCSQDDYVEFTTVGIDCNVSRYICRSSSYDIGEVNIPGLISWTHDAAPCPAYTRGSTQPLLCLGRQGGKSVAKPNQAVLQRPRPAPVLSASEKAADGGEVEGRVTQWPPSCKSVIRSEVLLEAEIKWGGNVMVFPSGASLGQLFLLGAAVGRCGLRKSSLCSEAQSGGARGP